MMSNSKINTAIQFTEGQAKTLFQNVNQQDLAGVVELLNIKSKEFYRKFIEVAFDYRHKEYTDEEYIKDLMSYRDELEIEYDKTGLKENWDKINKIHKLLEGNLPYTEDFRIVEEIRKEYIENKKMQKWTMMYLNKMYKELTKEK